MYLYLCSCEKLKSKWMKDFNINLFALKILAEKWEVYLNALSQKTMLGEHIAAHISRMKTTFFLCLSLFQLLVTKKKIFAKFTLLGELTL